MYRVKDCPTFYHLQSQDLQREEILKHFNKLPFKETKKNHLEVRNHFFNRSPKNDPGEEGVAHSHLHQVDGDP